MKILLTGGNGFLGRYILKEFTAHHVDTLGRGTHNSIQCDISKNRFPIKDYDYIIHAAGMAHFLPKTESERKTFFDVNKQGTKNLIDSIDPSTCSIRGIIHISTVAVYGLDEGIQISEEYPLHGQTPYAVSKIEAEKILLDFEKRTSIPVLILRLPLLIGINAPGNYGDMVKAMKKGYYFRIGSGNAKKSMVLCKDVANIIHQSLGKCGIYNLTDGKHPSLAELDSILSHKLGKKVIVIPEIFAKLLAQVGDLLPFSLFNSKKYQKLTRNLTFSDEKARKMLGWDPQSVIDNIEL